MEKLHRYGWLITIVALGGLFGAYVTLRPEPAAERLHFDAREDGSGQRAEVPPRPDAITGRTYVPAYSHAYVGSGQPVLFAITLSVRNVDPQQALVVRRVDYHATDGGHVRAMIDSARTIAPLGALELFVDRADETGGSGASFVIEWEIEPGARRPVAEAVMLGSAGPTGYSFVSVGVDASDVPGTPAPEPSVPEPSVPEPAPEPSTPESSSGGEAPGEVAEEPSAGP